MQTASDPYATRRRHSLSTVSEDMANLSSDEEDEIEEPKIYVIYEDSDRSQVFFDELAERGLPYVKWNVTNGCLPLDASPPPGVFWCRVSPSAASRGHHRTLNYTRELLHWLHLYGADIINGPEAFELEVSKARQVLACKVAGLRTPRSILAAANVQGLTLIVRNNFDSSEALYCKPNLGGSGMGVQCVESPAAFASGAASRLIHIANEATTMLQSECSNEARPCEASERHIFRAEFVSNASGPAFLYLLHIIAKPGMMSMCPCDDGKITGAGPSFEIIEPDTIMVDTVWREFVNSVFSMMRTNHMDIAAVEFKMLDGAPCVFDVNINNNYSEPAESASSVVEGVGATVELLEHRLEVAEGAAASELETEDIEGAASEPAVDAPAVDAPAVDAPAEILEETSDALVSDLRIE